ncbi:hypothetical protein C4D60_Mb03t05210 [Musa balbisiana]|uniref:MBD domain-containing protein n=1 Tax=Musa balbisiana TaxID=52838 RepID=A0A4S8J8R5_MUSBA|nr:hypothetical protein C4D60_Mb03t05210 [Musa balbisiana]
MQSYTEDAPLINSSPRTSKKSRKRSFDVSDRDAKDDGKQSTENISNHLVLYDPGTSDTGHDSLALTDVMENHTPTFRNFLASNSSGRTFPSIGTFTVQCASCFKWRIIPTKEKYEQIRENILEDPFVCEHAREWRPDILCEDPEDISQDGSRLWAIDKPNIAQPPPGWERLLRIRAEGGTKFADVYYTAPSGKRLRSMVEIQRYLLEHPEYARQGVTLSKFSFQSPRSLQENYVRKRPPRVTNPCDGGDMILPRTLEPEEVPRPILDAIQKETRPTQALISKAFPSTPQHVQDDFSPKKGERVLKEPMLMKNLPEFKDRTKYYKFYRDYGHDTEEY